MSPSQQSPLRKEMIRELQLRDFLHHLITWKKLGRSAINVRLAAYRFFFEQVLRKPKLELRVPSKRVKVLPQPLARSQVAKLLQAHPNIKHRSLLMTAYCTRSPLICWKPASI